MAAHVVFLSEGYGASEKAEFLADVRRLVREVITSDTAPLAFARDLLTVSTVFEASKVSGIPFGRHNKTAFGLYREGAVLRTLEPAPWSYVKARRLCDDCDIPVLLANDDYYGGVGDDVVVATKSKTSGALALRHELGHVLGDVGEEYDAGDDYSGANFATSARPCRPNESPRTYRIGAATRIEWPCAHWLLESSSSNTTSRAALALAEWPFATPPISRRFSSREWTEFATFDVSTAGALAVDLLLDGRRFKLFQRPPKKDRTFATTTLPLREGRHDLRLVVTSNSSTFPTTTLSKALWPPPVVCHLQVRLEERHPKHVVGPAPTFDSGRRLVGYRPAHRDCLMRDVTLNHFCPVCRDAILRRLVRRIPLLLDDGRINHDGLARVPSIDLRWKDDRPPPKDILLVPVDTSSSGCWDLVATLRSPHFLHTGVEELRATFGTPMGSLAAATTSASSCYDMVMADSWGDGWTNSSYIIADANGSTTVATGTLSDGSAQTDSVCLADGCYSLKVEYDEYFLEVTWEFGPFSGDGTGFGPKNFYASRGIVTEGCTPTSCFEMAMEDSWGDGWDVASYVINNGTGTLVATGTMLDGSSQTDAVCLVDGCYTLQVTASDYASEITWDFASGVLNGSSPYGPATFVVTDGAATEATSCSTAAPTGPKPTVAPTVSPAPTVTFAPSTFARPAETFADLETLVSSDAALVAVEIVSDLITFTSTVDVSNNTRREFFSFLSPSEAAPASAAASASRRRRLATSTTLDGQGTVQMFTVDGGELAITGPTTLTGGYAYAGGVAYVSGGGKIELTDVTVTNNNAEYGGAVVYLDGFTSNPCYGIFRNVEASGNVADSFGAVVFAEMSVLEVYGSSFASNTAYACGAVMARYSRLAMVGSRVSSNTADTFGGALCSYYTTYDSAVGNAKTNLTACEIGSNVASWQAGVIYNDASDVIIAASHVFDNVAMIDGGVDYEYFGASVSLEGGIFERNVAMEDGGLVDTADLYAGTILIEGATVEKNAAISRGGVVSASFFSSSGGRAILRGGTYVGNSGDEGGVANVDNGPLFIDAAVFSECSATYGGVVFANLAEVELRNSTFSRNNATFGGVVAVDEAAAAVVFSNCTARGNEASAQGGVVYCGRDACRLKTTGDGAAFVSNRAVEGSTIYVPAFATGDIRGPLVLAENVAFFSGAIYVGLGSTTTISNLASTRNVAFDSGAFAYCASLSTVKIADAVSTGDAASLNGIVYVGIGATATLEDTAFVDAKVLSGTVYATGFKSLETRRATFRGGRALDSGAAIYAQSFERIFVSDVSFAANDAVQFGGGMYLDAGTSDRAEARVVNSTATSNAAADGAVLVATGSALEVILENVNATANLASSSGGVGAVRDGATLSLRKRSIFVRNAAEISAGVFAVDGGAKVGSNGGALIRANAARAGGGGAFSLATNAAVELRAGDVVVANSAPLGGGGVAYFDHTTATQPSFEEVTLAANSALYGDVVASNVASIKIEHAADREASGVEFETPVTVTALDALGQVVKTDQSERVEISSPYQNVTLDGTLKLVFETGVASTYAFVAYGTYDSTLRLRASLDLDHAGIYEDAASIYLRACVPGEHWSPAGRACEVCGVGTYSFDPAKACETCDDNAECAGGYSFVTHKGYWRSNRFSDNVRRCLIEDHCLPDVDLWTITNASFSDGDNALCADHHVGPMCAACEDGYAFDANLDCVACPNTTRTWTAIGFFFAFLLVVAILVVAFAYLIAVSQPRCVDAILAFAKAKYKLVCESSLVSWTKFKLLIIHWQTLTSQIAVFNFIKYPKVASILNVIGLDIAGILSMGFCRSDVLDRLLTVTVLPALLLGAVGVRHLLEYARFFKKESSRSTTTARGGANGGEESASLDSLRAETITLVLTVTFVVYTSVSASVFNALRCDHVFEESDGESDLARYYDESYMIADYSIRCGSARYEAFELYAYCMVLVYPIGIPVVYTLILALQLDDVNPQPERVLRIAEGIVAESNGDPPPTDVPRLDYRLVHPPALAGGKALDYSKPPRDLLDAATDYISIAKAAGIESKAAKSAASNLVVLQRSGNPNIAPLKILYHDYLPKYWFFEAVMCVWRLLLTCVLPAFVRAENALALLYGTTLLSFAYCVLIIMVQPYADQGTNFAASMLAVISTVTMTLTVWWFVESNLQHDVSAGWSTAALGNSLIFINVICGPLSLVIDIGFEFDLIATLGACVVGLFTVNFLKSYYYKKYFNSPADDDARVDDDHHHPATTTTTKTNPPTLSPFAKKYAVVAPIDSDADDDAGSPPEKNDDAGSTPPPPNPRADDDDDPTETPAPPPARRPDPPPQETETRPGGVADDPCPARDSQQDDLSIVDAR
ncbi:hypothetical protein CTAYLR_000951 [Chrysophaeum taylorii]|uniref:Right handed beta helix domain-containing protein n=1 Tax=Chrysophaeum taylorii TaxID=2483200 RepID=A0AAD7UHJ0_9STRA|nr:hypothetical protein CTAYLR_000951 [Chrysophaeum taylorii]